MVDPPEGMKPFQAALLRGEIQVKPGAVHPDSQDAKCNPAEDDESDANRVFEFRSDAVTRAFERAVARARTLYVDECRAAKLKPDGKFLTDLRFHDLRHEATSRLASIFPMH
ncbi:integrase [Pandoraea communis]|uniref:Integrase n=1 Tax=Pandoraea communis TaxID=2508297 RepID=A0A5E4SV32_9BURK|nr:integrase [Pandoraea communis]